ncbi:hypothetical protein [Frigoribacterium sp. VKM Ac-2836]|uniref:hypothetical protein n=1 Tax=Frigoribacterium sp. VKM Ac-2836 TaxID=2739014 RepID=UPI00156485DD|nr:hypothetical protein [Frigoribacterium sp. VKM Ac-2836]NRD26217.1 hypothetical protein [Frigoribacterium sp. VKM Ac-2836]
MAKTRELLMTSTLAVGALVAATGCTSDPAVTAPTAAGTGSPSVTATTAPVDAAPASAEQAIVTRYLDAIADADTAAAWALLSPEAQDFYGSESTFASTSATDGTVTPDEAAVLRDAPLVSAEGPEGAFTLVSATTDELADAWVVRETADGLRVDDAGVPPTGDSLYEWINPAAGAEDQTAGGAAYDTTAPASISFASPQSQDQTEPSVVGYPDTLWVFLDGEQLPSIAAVSAGSGKRFTTEIGESSGAGRGLTVVWQTGDDSLGWRSSTVVL